MSGRGECFHGDVDLDVIGKAVALKCMLEDYLAKGGEDEEEGAENWTLRDTFWEGSRGGLAVVDADEQISVREGESELKSTDV